MSRLSDVIGQVIETQTDAGGRLDVPNAVEEALAMLNDEDRVILAREALFKRIKDKAGSSTKGWWKNVRRGNWRCPSRTSSRAIPSMRMVERSF